MISFATPPNPLFQRDMACIGQAECGLELPKSPRLYFILLVEVAASRFRSVFFIFTQFFIRDFCFLSLTRPSMTFFPLVPLCVKSLRVPVSGIFPISDFRRNSPDERRSFCPREDSLPKLQLSLDRVFPFSANMFSGALSKDRFNRPSRDSYPISSPPETQKKCYPIVSLSSC